MGLSELVNFDVSSKKLTGILTEPHFWKLTKLKYLHLGPNWVPPFQLQDLCMGDCHLGTSIPAWLKSQKKLKHLDFSYACISGSIPSWFWETISNLALLNVSFNQLLHGQLPSPLMACLDGGWKEGSRVELTKNKLILY